MTDICESCRIKPVRAFDTPILPDFKENSTILFVSDYPLEEDVHYGKTLSGLHKRTTFIHRFIKEARLDQDTVSHATVMRCITRSKSILQHRDFTHCGSQLVEAIAQHTSIQAVFCFGSMAGSCITGKHSEHIEKSRGQVLDSVIPGVFCVITYALGLLVDHRGCGGCGSNSWPFLAHKDMSLLQKELKKRNADHKGEDI